MAKRKRKQKKQPPLQQKQQQQQEQQHQREKMQKKNQNQNKKNNTKQHQEENQHHEQKLEEQQTNDHQVKKRRKGRHERNKKDKDRTKNTKNLSLATKLRRLRGTAESTPLPSEWSGCTRYYSDKTNNNTTTNNNRRRGNKSFLTLNDDYDESDGGRNIATASDFQSCLNECYHGFHWEDPSSLPSTLHNTFSHAFHNLDTAQFFLHDAVQPGGKKISRTYVTRTLVGHPGTTYRYLGLRLFSHPWCDVDENGDAAVVEDDDDQQPRQRRRGQSLRQLGYTPPAMNGLLSLGDVNRQLISRTEQLLTDKISPHVRPEGLVGSASYNISLVNRMEPTSVTTHDLREESLFGMGKTSVSWHSDSGLQDFSSIAVYHQLIPPSSSSQKQQQRRQRQKRPWRVALRVSSETTKTPALCVPLPHGALYYLLDDFNHKHEHAVLTGEDDSLRYSSTHRVTKEACGTWQYIRDKCETLLSSSTATMTAVGHDGGGHGSAVVGPRGGRVMMTGENIAVQQKLLTKT